MNFAQQLQEAIKETQNSEEGMYQGGLQYHSRDALMKHMESEMDIPDLMAVMWNTEKRQPAFLLKEDYPALKGDIAKWRKSIREGKMVVQECNLTEVSPNYDTDKLHTKFHTLTLQFPDADGELKTCQDPVAMCVFGWMVDGLTYFFTDKKVRDMIAKYLKTGKN
jgi:hypothetical protein